MQGGSRGQREGLLVGSFHFHGLRDFTRVDSHRIHAEIFRQPPQVCREEKEPAGVTTVGLGQPGGVPDDSLRLIAAGSSGSPHFEAVAERHPATESAPPIFLAYVSQAGKGFSVVRSGLGSDADGSGFVTADPLSAHSTATVEPAAPFTGSATFEAAAPRGDEFSGDLAVELPGLGEVPLTGPEVAAGICRRYTCTKTLPPRLRPNRSDSFFGEPPS